MLKLVVIVKLYKKVSAVLLSVIIQRMKDVRQKDKLARGNHEVQEEPSIYETRNNWFRTMRVLRGCNIGM